MLLALLFLGGGEPSAGRREDGPTEYEVKAALIEKFLRYVEWPDSAFEGDDAPLVVGVYGEDPFGGAIDKVFRGKLKDDHPFRVRRVKEAGEIASCHVLFVPVGESKDAAELLGPTSGRPLLAIGESRDFARQGGVINFYLDKSHIRFEVNPDEAKRRKLFISSSLLKLARIVRDAE